MGPHLGPDGSKFDQKLGFWLIARHQIIQFVWFCTFWFHQMVFDYFWLLLMLFETHSKFSTHFEGFKVKLNFLWLGVCFDLNNLYRAFLYFLVMFTFFDSYSGIVYKAQFSFSWSLMSVIKEDFWKVWFKKLYKFSHLFVWEKTCTETSMLKVD